MQLLRDIRMRIIWSLFREFLNGLIKKQVVTLPLDNYVKERIVRYTIAGLEELCCINVINYDTPDLHSHPWNYISIILKGGYVEEVFKDGKLKLSYRGIGTIAYRRFDDMHAVHLRKGPCVTLFIKTKKMSTNTRWMKDGVSKPEAAYWLRQGYNKDDLKKMYERTTTWIGVFE